MKRFLSSVSIVLLLFLTGCSKVPANTVFSVDDLSGKKIGVQLKTTGDIYASSIEGAEIFRFNIASLAIDALTEGKIDAVIIDEDPARVFTEKNDKITILDDAFSDESYAIAVSKEKPELLKDINGALTTLTEDGTIDYICEQWLSSGDITCAYTPDTGIERINGQLVMVTNAEFPPYETLTDDNVIVGIDVDIMNAVCDLLQMELVIKNTSFDSLISFVSNGKADVCAAALSITEARLEYVDFSTPYTTSRQVIIVRSK